MHVLDWTVILFDQEIENADIESQLEDEVIDMRVNLEIKSLFRNKSLNNYWSNVNTVTKYLKFTAVVETFLLAFLCSYMVLFTNPSVRAGYDTRSIFKRSLTGLNSEFPFS